MRHKRIQNIVKKRLVKHFKSVPGRIELLVLYGALMFVMGVSLNHVVTVFRDQAPQENILDGFPAPESEDAAETSSTSEPTATESANETTAEDNNLQTPDSATQEEENPAISLQEHEKSLTLTVKKGDNFSDLLNRSGVKDTEIQSITEALRKEYNIRQLSVGQEVVLYFDETSPGSENTTRKSTGGKPLMLTSLVVEEPERIIQVARDPAGNYLAQSSRKQLKRTVTFAQGEIKSSLSELAEQMNLSFSLIAAVVSTFSYEIDFQRDIQPGAKFEVLYEEYYDENGNKVRSGHVLYAMLEANGEHKRLYRYTPRSKGAEAEYYNDEGRTTRRQLLRTPVNGAFISSGFGIRRHPISGYTKMHKGIDFAAPSGTPVYAAGDGNVVKSERFGGYGNYIRLSHNKEFDTAYAHLSRYAKGLRPGKPVKQGEVIGYVGTTGASTGPHLHYEVLRYGQQINPQTLKMLPAQQLSSRELSNFQLYRSKIDRLIDKKPVKVDTEVLLRMQ